MTHTIQRNRRDKLGLLFLFHITFEAFEAMMAKKKKMDLLSVNCLKFEVP